MKWEVRTMRSGTSFFDGTVFKKTVFRFWPLWGMYLAAWLIALPLSGLMMLRMDSGHNSYGRYMEDFALYRVPGSVADDGMVVFLLFGVLAAMAVFSHLYNARSANLFGSLPVRREGLFLTHYLSGLSFLIVPNVVIFLLTLAVEAAGGCVVMKGLLFWLAVACGESFFFYSLAVFCAMFTGHILALPAFYVIVNFFVLTVTGLVTTVFEVFYYGFAGFPDGVDKVVEWLTPTNRLYGVVDSWTAPLHENPVNSVLSNDELALVTEGLGTVGIYALAALALTVGAFFLYRARRLESAGDVVAVRPMRPVFKYGVALCVGLVFGMGTMFIIGGGDVTLMIAIVVWGVIGYFAAEMLLQKSFKVFKKWRGAAAVTAVFVVLFLVVGFDLTGFETRVPNPDSVDSVEISGLAVMYLDDDGDHFAGTITAPEAIRWITLLHKAAVNQRDYDWDDWYKQGGSTTSLYVTYHLKNGGVLSRQYYSVGVTPSEAEREGTAAWAVQQIYNDRELCWQMYGFDRLEDYLAAGGRLSEAEYERYDDEEGWTGAYYYGGDPEILLAAVKEDFFAGRIGARRVIADKWDVYDAGNYGFLCFSSDSRDGGRYYIRITLSETASSTWAALRELTPAMELDGGEYPGEGTVKPTSQL